MNRAVFLDRDGVINKDVDLLSSINEIKLIDGSYEAVRILNKLGFKVIVVTNQPGVAKGHFTEDDVNSVNEEIKKRFASKGAVIDAFYYCPHHPDRGFAGERPEYKIECNCRKPKIGMLERAAKDFDLNLESCFIIGDRTVDMKTGENAGCRKILVRTGYAGRDNKYNAVPDFIADDLLGAAKLIRHIKQIEDAEMKAVVLVGGRGERLRPLTDNIPKPMLEIKGKPILEHQIELLKKYGIRNVLVCGHYLFEKIKDYFGDGSEFGVKIDYSDEEIPMGTGGAIKKVESLIDSTFIVLYGDIMLEMDLMKLVMFHKKKSSLLTLVLHESDHPYDSDLVETDSSRVIKILGKHVENPPTRLAKTSIFIAEPEVLEFLSDGKSDFDAEALPKIVETGKVFGYTTDEFIKDIGTVDRYERVRKRFENA
jgi:D,D-heptose 1,7-bisphosphate phosphatase